MIDQGKLPAGSDPRFDFTPKPSPRDARNVRQFANTLERAAIFCQGARLSMQDVELAFQRSPGSAAATPGPGAALPPEGTPLRQAVQDYEKALILSALKRTNGVQTEAAKLLGVSAKNLWNKLQKHGIDPDNAG